MGEDADLRTDPLLEKAPVHEGYKVLGGVVLYQKLGQGGMGAVYRGKHLRLEVDVALKVMATPAGIHPDQAANYLQRFLREAKTAASVRHSNLIRVYDVNAEGGVHFLIMDYIDGESAGDRLKRKGRLDEQEAVEIALGAAEGLAAAHRTGIVHRDVKPDNILIDKQGDVVVADLGLAKAYGAGESDSAMSMGLSLTQQAMGTPYYMAPEQTMSAKDVGPAADVWSLGVTLYQLATDSLPWSDSDIVNLMVRIRAEAAPDIRQVCPGLSEGLCAIIEKALKKDPAERYADCGAMAEALTDHLDAISTSRKSVLPDAEAGMTKLALVTLTPPPSKTLTLIGASLIAVGESASRGERRESARAEAPAGAGVSPATPGTPATFAAPRRGGAGMVLLVLLVAAALGGGGFAAWYFLAGPGSERERTAGKPGVATREGEPSGEPGISGSGSAGASPSRSAAEVEAGRKKREAEANVASILKTARSFRDAGLLDKARDEAAEALKALPDHTEARRFLGDVQAEIAAKKSAKERAADYKRWMDKALDLKLAGELEEAAEAYAKAAEYAPPGMNEAAEAAAACITEFEERSLAHREKVARGRMAEVLTFRASELLARPSRWGEAVGFLDAALGYDDKLAKAYFLRGTLLSKLGKSEDAIKDFEKVDELARSEGALGHARALVAAGDVCRRQLEDRSRAVRYYRRAVEVAPGSPYGRLGEIRVHMLSGEIRSALGSADSATREMEPQGVDVSRIRLALAQILAELGERKRAIEEVGTVLLDAPVYVEALILRGRLFAEDKQYEAAIRDLARAIELAPADPGATRLLAEAKKHLGPAKTMTLDLGGGVAMELVYIRPGRFTMGSNSGSSDGRPAHQVSVSSGFYMGKYEVTQVQYERIMGKNPSRFKGTSNPVEQVSWIEATEFCRKLSQRTGGKVRLPTEAEWEFACRAGSTTRFCFGDSDNGLGDYAWYRSNSGSKTHAVGGKRANAWGLHDMHGNVWEWCSDWYEKGYYAKSPGRDPSGPTSGGYRVLRGGSWYNFDTLCRSASRGASFVKARWGYVGFRVAAELQD